ncbi:MAG: multicopper oxidase domain-containing protein [Verrucomicrobia bacterium]|nr:multicopper oxidase domain-containing protein [Verrucomicrobiota bacterium]
MSKSEHKISRRELLKMGALASGVTLLGDRNPANAQGGIGTENYPTSPWITQPFTDPLPIPQPLAPSDVSTWAVPPDPAAHQIWPSALGLPDPVFYNIKLQVASHSFTTSPVRPINKSGRPVSLYDAAGRLVSPSTRTTRLPRSTIYGFNGTFPGPLIHATYDQPCLVRFENHLAENPLNLPRGDFGDPELKFLTHLHNGHTAPESDGNPHHRPHGYSPGEFADNLYLNTCPSDDPTETQSFLWFHDHTHSHTGANVYKGMVGLYYMYDTMDCNDERTGWRLPSGEYDIPLALYDVLLDDGVTPHTGNHDQDGLKHPENWGHTFFAHYPNHGFVGDIMTVNGTAYPVLHVKRRKYRLRFLDCSISRLYNLKLATGTLRAAPGTQGQWELSGARQCMRFTQIAVDGGLLPKPIVRNDCYLFPAKRREMIVDFSKYLDGTPTTTGDVLYLVNTLAMTDGRKPTGTCSVPIMKIVIDGDPVTPDLSLMPDATTPLRTLPTIPNAAGLARCRRRKFELVRGGGTSEEQWQIKTDNGPALPFDVTRSMADVPFGSGEVWEIVNGGGGWVHPMHFHMEEHRTITRNGVPCKGDDISKEDVIGLEPGETVVMYRRFRTFRGNYVAHCHNLAHEDHAMMFGWRIV